MLREEDPQWFEPDRQSQGSRVGALLGQRLVLQDGLCVTWAVMLCSVLSSCFTSWGKAPGGCQCWDAAAGEAVSGTEGHKEAGASEDELLRLSTQREVGCRQCGDTTEPLH